MDELCRMRWDKNEAESKQFGAFIVVGFEAAVQHVHMIWDACPVVSSLCCCCCSFTPPCHSQPASRWTQPGLRQGKQPTLPVIAESVLVSCPGACEAPGSGKLLDLESGNT